MHLNIRETKTFKTVSQQNVLTHHKASRPHELTLIHRDKVQQHSFLIMVAAQHLPLHELTVRSPAQHSQPARDHSSPFPSMFPPNQYEAKRQRCAAKQCSNHPYPRQFIWVSSPQLGTLALRPQRHALASAHRCIYSTLHVGGRGLSFDSLARIASPADR